MAETTGAAGVAERLPELWARFRPGIIERVDRLEDAVVALLAGTLDAVQRREAEREAHKLAGSVGTFGYAEASRHARAIEVALEGDRQLLERDALVLSDRVLALRRSLDEAPVERPRPPNRPGMVLLTADEDLAERAGMEAEARGLRFNRVSDAEGLREALATGAASAVVIDLAAASREDPFAVLEGVVGPGGPETLVISDSDAFAERVEAVRRGVSGYLRRPLSPLHLVDSVERALRRVSAAGASVLVVDDDPAMLELVSSILTAAGMKVSAARSASTFWRELAVASPDLVVLDVDMPELSGLELCRAIRADPRWGALPVIFLTARTDRGTVEAAFEAGADDYVGKPIAGPELVRRIENRLARVEGLGVANATRAPGRLPERLATRDALRRLLQLARRAAVPACVVRVALADSAALERALGSGGVAGARDRVADLLEAAVEAGDVVGWWGGNDFALGCFAAGAGATASRLEQARRQLAGDRFELDGTTAAIDFAYAVAACPDDGDDLEELLNAAERALGTAVEGRLEGRITSAASRGAGGAEVVDVAIVEDDIVIAELLQQALSVQGFSSRRIGDGDEALRLLGGHDAPLRARAILLDVDLPGRDGLSILRELARTRTVERSRVVMLTARSTEREVLAALELGASDHVSKPFSVPVLLRRVRALIERG